MKLKITFFTILFLLSLQRSQAQNVNATWGANGNTAWYTGGNWAGGSYAGAQGAAASNTNIATFTSAFTGTTTGINMGTNSLNLGAISLDNTRTTATNIGNSSATGGVLRLYGATVNSVANTVARNNGAGLLTLQVAQNGSMGVVLSNATDNIFQIDNTGGIAISSIISGANKLTKGGSGTGILQLTGANTYTGLTTVTGGTLELNRTGGTTIPTGNSVTVNSGGTLLITTAQQLANVTVDPGGKLIVAATLTITGTATINGTFQINQGGFATGGTWTYGSSSTLVYNNTSGVYGPIDASHSYWPSSGPVNVTVQGAGGINLGVSRTVTGNFQTAAGVTLSSGAVITINGNCQINTGGVFNNVPTYGGASTLIYNQGSTPTFGNEWTGNSTTAGLGIPFNVTLQNSTTLNLPTTDRGMAGSLTITSGTLSLNATSGDLYVAGNWNNSGTFTPNLRAVFFNGAGPKTITKTGGETFDYLLINKSSGTMQLGSNVTITANKSVTLTNGGITLGNFDFILNSGVTLNSYSSSKYFITNGTGQLKQIVAGSAKIFPVGNSAYNPLTLTNTGTSDTYGIRVQDGSISGLSPNDVTLTIDRRWLITEAVAGNSTLTIAATYNAGEENNSTAFNAGTQPYIGLYDGTFWSETTATGTNTFTATTTVAPTNLTTAQTIALGKDYGIIGVVIPAITSFSASVNDGTGTHGYIGSTITITGTNFTGVTTVKYGGSGGTSVGSFTVVNPTTITFTAPAAMTGTLYVQNVNGNNDTSVSSYTNLGYITQTGATDWATATSWLGGNIPPASATTTIGHNLNIASAIANSPVTIIVNSGKTLSLNNAASAITVATSVTNNGTVSFTNTGSMTVLNFINSSTGTVVWSAAGTLNIAAAGTFTNNGTFTGGAVASNLSFGAGGTLAQAGTFTAGSGKISFSSGTITGTLVANNIDVSGALVLSTATTINGILSLNSSGYIDAPNAPTYGTSSTLTYNIGGTFNRGQEWTGASSGVGYPYNVRLLASGTIFNMGLGTAYCGGNITVENGTILNTPAVELNVSGNFTTVGTGGYKLFGDVKVIGNWTIGASASIDNNGKAVFFNGTGTQTITKTSGGVVFFDYIVIEKTAGKAMIESATAVTINTTTGDFLQLNNIGTFDLNGRTLTLNNNGGNIATNGANRLITSGVTGAIIAVTGTKTVSGAGTLILDENVTTVLTNGIDFGSSKTTVKGILQINGGGYVITNPPVYSSAGTTGSTLIYNGNYTVATEWTNNGTTAGSGTPYNVTVQNSAVVTMPSGDRGMLGTLTVTSGSITFNGDLYLGGDLTVNSGNSIAANTKAIFFTKNGTQNIAVTTTPVLNLHYVILSNYTGSTATTVKLLSNINITAPSTGNAIAFSNAADVFDLNGKNLSIGTASVNNTITGSGTFKGSTTSGLTLLGGSGSNNSVGTLTFATDLNLGTLTVNRFAGTTALTLGSALTINTSLVLTNGLVALGTNVLTMSSSATASGASSNSYVIADLGGTSGSIRKNITATGSFTFPIGDRVASADGGQYTPATVNFTGGTFSSAYLTVGIQDIKHPNNDATTDYITRYWNVIPSGTFTNPVYNFTGTYTAADITGTEANSKPGRYDGSLWTDVSVTSISANTLSLTGVTTLSASNDFSAGFPLANAEINIKQASTNYLHNSTYAFGNQGSGTSSSAITFTVQNLGAASLLLNGSPIISKSGTNASEFSVDVTGTATTVTGFSTTTFTVTFSPTSYGAKTAAISIANNDATGGENPYVINFTGTGSTKATDYFRSAVNNGDWATAATWESSTTGSGGWTVATLAPGTSASDITIRNNYDVISSGNVAVSSITLAGNGILEISGGTFTFNNGPSAIDCMVNGNLLNSGGTIVQSAGSTMAFSATGKYNHTAPATTSLDIPIATWDVASNCNIKGVNNTAAFSGNASFGQTFGNFTWNNPNQLNFVNISNSAFRVNGTLTVGGNATNLLSFSNIGTSTNTVNNIVLTGGILNCVGNAGTSTLTVLGDITISGGGTFYTSYGAGTGIVNLSGNLILNNNGYFIGAYGTSGTGTTNISGSVTVNSGGFFLGSAGPGTGNTNVTGSVNVVTGGEFYVAFDTGNASLITAQNINVSGFFACSESSGTATVTAGANLEISGTGYVVVMDKNTSPSTTLNITNNLKISDTGLLNLENKNSTGVATVNVGGNFNCTATDFAVDFGANHVTGNTINITGNFDKSGTGTFQTSSSSAATGFAFGSGVHTFSYTGTDSQWTSYVVKSGAKLQMLSGLNLDLAGTTLTPPSTFSVESGGTLDFQTYAVKAGNSTSPRFITTSGATLFSANTDGLGGVSSVGSLQNFGSIGSGSAAGRAVFATGVNYTFNGTTTVPFPIPTSTAIGNPATVTINGNVTSNMVSNLTVTAGLNVNNGGTFKLNPSNNNSLNLNNCPLTIALGGTFDNGGENAVNSGGGSPSIQISGTFLTRDNQGFTGSNTAIPGITPTLNSGGTVEYGGADQAVQGTIPSSQNYQNITFSGTGTKTLASNNTVVGTITVKDVIFNADNNTFGSSTSGITMTGNALYKLNGSSFSKPESGGTYNLGPNTTFEYTGTSATNIRVSSPTITYSNIVISGTNVSNQATSVGIKFRSGGTFSVLNNGIFKLKNLTGFTGSTTSAIDTSTNGGPTISLATGSRIQYDAATSDGIQTITPFATYSDLGVSGTGTKILGSTAEVLVGRDLYVTAGTLQIDSDRLLTVTNAISSVDDAIKVKNNGSLVQLNDGVADTGKIIATRTSRTMVENDYIYWGSPVQGDVASQIPSIFEISYSWVINGAADGYWDYLSTTSPGNGFITRMGSAGTANFNFNGVPNNGVINVSADSYDNGATVEASGNTILLSNPYPCAIDAKKFVDLNSSSLEGTLYFWTSTTPITNNVYTANDYASWNFVGGTTTGGSALTPTGKISTGQGFFANLKSDGGVVFNNSIRVHNVATDNSQFFRNGNTESSAEYNRIWLNITNPDNAFRQALVGYVSGATNDFDSKYDGYNFTDNAINISSILNDKLMVIQGRALPFDVNDLVPLSVKIPTIGTNTIAIDHTDGLFSLDQDIYLQDNLLNVIHDLKAAPYTFQSEPGTFNDRFVLRYTNSTLGVGIIDNTEGKVIVAKEKNQLKIQSTAATIEKVVVFDLLGRKVFEKEQINSNTFLASDIVLNQQAIIVKVTLSNGTIVTKKIIF
ncbi:MAG: T9SS sorting signal type C domain-containing protein [Flavobacterium sp.]|nr:T9SS sorting signal type C domain-containing protein [Flavobacterium sp.]